MPFDHFFRGAVGFPRPAHEGQTIVGKGLLGRSEATPFEVIHTQLLAVDGRRRGK